MGASIHTLMGLPGKDAYAISELSCYDRGMTHLPRTVRERANAHWTREEDDLLRSRVANGRRPSDLARLHGRELASICARLKELGLSQDSQAA